jgi:hypothetical protein
LHGPPENGIFLSQWVNHFTGAIPYSRQTV